MAQVISSQQSHKVYEQLGVQPIVNAAGHETAAGGSIMPPEVQQAMVDAGSSYVMIEELNRAVGQKIAEATGAEAGYVTAGSAAGLLLAVAACITGTDKVKINQLPDVHGLAHEVIMHRTHRINYDRMFRAAGGKIVEIGMPRGTDRWELEAAINHQTACIAFIDSPSTAKGALPFKTVVEVARERGIPVIVDAASTLPPVDHLKRWIREGADLVVYSGGKGIRGPQNSGLLAGRSDLIEAARANGNPNAGVGRGAKVSKESMVGLAVALDLFLARDHDAEFNQHQTEAEAIKAALARRNDVHVSIISDRSYEPTPVVQISHVNNSEWIAEDIQSRMMNDSPRVRLRVQHGELLIKTQCFAPGDEQIVVNSLERALDASAGVKRAG